MSLLELDVSNNALGVEGVEACSAAFGRNLEALHMVNNGLSAEAMERVRVRT